MFEAIRNNWTINAGYKKKIGHGPTLTESLMDLHDGSCLTGLKVSCPVSQVVTVTLKSHGETLTNWTQSTNTLEPLPFPFPSWMAKEMGLTLEVSVSGNDLLSVIIVIHEINLPRKDRYLFVSASGKPMYHWNKVSYKRADLAIKKLHIRIPSVSAILTGEDISLVCIHEWSETF
jgi:hypothetical protein